MDRHAIGDYVRTLRQQRHPATFGFGEDGRRTPGLRRAEVAELAHISVDHYTNLEQGRGSSPSRQVLSSVASALHLGDNERRHLFELADEVPPRATSPSTEVADSVRQLIRGLPTTAALVLSARYDVLAWNDLATYLLEDFAELDPRRRNLMRRHFLPLPDGQIRHYGMSGIRDFSLFAVGQLQSTLARYPHDPETLALIHELRAASREFDDLWADAVVTIGMHTTKQLTHPTLGDLALVCDVLLVPDHDQHVVLLSAPEGSPTQAQIVAHATRVDAASRA